MVSSPVQGEIGRSKRREKRPTHVGSKSEFACATETCRSGKDNHHVTTIRAATPGSRPCPGLGAVPKADDHALIYHGPVKVAFAERAYGDDLQKHVEQEPGPPLWEMFRVDRLVTGLQVPGEAYHGLCQGPKGPVWCGKRQERSGGLE
jgi:hypothetical protein